MSHFTVLVIGNDPESQLAPYDENIEMPRYVRYTKEELIKREREFMDQYKEGTYAEYIADPEKYVERYNASAAHLDYLKNTFPANLKRTDEEIYRAEIADYEDEDISPDGGVYSTYNPNSKWDWYELGGRWSGMIKLKETATSGKVGKPGVFDNEAGIDSALKADIANLDEISTFAVVKDSKWYEKGRMLYFACVADEKSESEWNDQFKQLLADLPDDTLMSIYDCHI